MTTSLSISLPVGFRDKVRKLMEGPLSVSRREFLKAAGLGLNSLRSGSLLGSLFQADKGKLPDPKYLMELVYDYGFAGDTYHKAVYSIINMDSNNPEEKMKMAQQAVSQWDQLSRELSALRNPRTCKSLLKQEGVKEFLSSSLEDLETAYSSFIGDWERVGRNCNNDALIRFHTMVYKSRSELLRDLLAGRLPRILTGTEFGRNLDSIRSFARELAQQKLKTKREPETRGRRTEQERTNNPPQPSTEESLFARNNEDILYAMINLRPRDETYLERICKT